MTIQQLYVIYNDLLRAIDLPELIDVLFLKAVKSGALNVEAEDSESSQLPQIIVHATLCEPAEKFKPVNPDSLIESENLIRFL